MQLRWQSPPHSSDSLRPQLSRWSRSRVEDSSDVACQRGQSDHSSLFVQRTHKSIKRISALLLQMAHRLHDRIGLLVSRYRGKLHGSGRRRGHHSQVGSAIRRGHEFRLVLMSKRSKKVTDRTSQFSFGDKNDVVVPGRRQFDEPFGNPAG